MGWLGEWRTMVGGGAAVGGGTKLDEAMGWMMTDELIAGGPILSKLLDERRLGVRMGWLGKWWMMVGGGTKIGGAAVGDGTKLGEATVGWMMTDGLMIGGPTLSELLEEGRLSMVLEILRERKFDIMAGWTMPGWITPGWTMPG